MSKQQEEPKKDYGFCLKCNGAFRLESLKIVKVIGVFGSRTESQVYCSVCAPAFDEMVMTFPPRYFRRTEVDEDGKPVVH